MPGAEDAFWAFDANQARITLFRLDDVLAGRTRGTRQINLEVPRILYELALLDADEAVGLGLFGEGRLALIELAASRIRYAGPLPPPAHEDEPPSIRQHAYQAQMAVRPDRERVVLASWRGGILELFDRAGHLLARVDGPFPFEPDYLIDEGARGLILQRGRLNRAGYVDVTATDQHIVALFSGRAEAHYRRDMDLAEYLHIFDWDGNFVGAYRLDRPARKIALAPRQQLIFALTTEPEPLVLTFPMPDMLMAPKSDIASVP